MRTIIIDGEVLCSDKMDGIHRFMLEILTRIDQLLPREGVEIHLLHSEGREIKGLSLKNIKVVSIKKHKLVYRVLDVPRYVKKQRGIYCSMSNDIIFYRDSICTLMDLIPLSKLACYPKKSLLKMKLIYACIKCFAKKIVTISQASKKDIVEKLGIPEERIHLVGTGWEHMEKLQEAPEIFQRYPELEKGNYYYAIGNQYPYKNFIWVQEVARRSPDLTFVVAGKVTNILSPALDAAKNMRYVGYITDEEHKALLKHAKAFLHPSKLEGFGIPPLEALSQGVPVAVARASCLPEIYGDTVHYFDPDDYTVDLNKLFEEPVKDSQELLRRYSWDQVAQDFLEILTAEGEGALA